MSKLKNNDYKVINMITQYGTDLVGDYKFLILTDLSESDLIERYGEKISVYEPYLIMKIEAVEIFKEFSRNENKHRMRSFKQFYLDSKESTREHISIGNLEEDYEINIVKTKFEKGMECLPEKQRNRLEKYVLDKLTIREIAAEEHVEPSAVSKSITSAKKFLKNFLENG